MTETRRPLIVAAHTAELADFPRWSRKVDYLVTGVGKVRAAASLAAHLSHYEPSEIIVVGTAAWVAEHMHPAIGTVMSVGTIYQHDVSDEHGRGGHHVAMPANVHGGGSEAMLSTGDSFITDAAPIRELHPQVQLADMESFVYVWVAQQWGIERIRVFKAVSDAGDNDDWDRNVAACSRRLYQRIQAEGVFS